MARAERKAREAKVVWAMATQLAGNETVENLWLALSGMDDRGENEY